MHESITVIAVRHMLHAAPGSRRCRDRARVIVEDGAGARSDRGTYPTMSGAERAVAGAVFSSPQAAGRGGRMMTGKWDRLTTSRTQSQNKCAELFDESTRGCGRARSEGEREHGPATRHTQTQRCQIRFFASPKNKFFKLNHMPPQRRSAGEGLRKQSNTAMHLQKAKPETEESHRTIK